MLTLFHLSAVYLFLILLVVLLVYLAKIVDRLNALLQSVEKIRQSRVSEEKAAVESEPATQAPLPVPEEPEAETPPPLPAEEPVLETPPPLPVIADVMPLKEEEKPILETPPPLPAEEPASVAGQVQGRMRSLKNWLLYGQFESPEASGRSAEKLHTSRPCRN